MDVRNPNDLDAHARVRVVLELKVGSWAQDATVQQVFAQAAESAVGLIRAAFPKADPESFQIIGEPHVTAVFAKKAPQF